jgi:hypothetical protein
VITSHSVIDKPEPVSRVMPPSITWMMIMATPITSQVATGLEDLISFMWTKLPDRVAEKFFTY